MMMKVKIIFAGLLIFTVSMNKIPSAEVLKPAPLLETHWNLVELEGKKIPDSLMNQQMFLILKNLNRVEGNGGCNSFSSTFVLKKNNEINFGEIVSTRMMCPGIQYETTFFKAISLTDHYSLNKDTLSFIHGKDMIVARFAAGKKKVRPVK